MGQRHQVFIRTKNPVDTLELSGEEKKRGIKMFGRGKYTVLAFHHQWLYGMSALYNALKVLKFNTGNKSEYSHLFGKKLNYQMRTIDMFTASVTFLMALVTDDDFPRGKGYERFHFLNEEEPYMRENFTAGDNNDGVTIIDTITNKYCFMRRIYGKVSTLIPETARKYVKYYYPESLKDVDKDDMKYYNKKENKKEKDELIENFDDNIVRNHLLEQKFSEFELLTLGEVKRMFPKVFKEEKKKEKVEA